MIECVECFLEVLPVDLVETDHGTKLHRTCARLRVVCATCKQQVYRHDALALEGSYYRSGPEDARLGSMRGRASQYQCYACWDLQTLTWAVERERRR